MNNLHWDNIYKKQYEDVQKVIIPLVLQRYPKELKFQRHRLIQLLRRFVKPFDYVVEFGSGSGHIAELVESLGYEVLATDQSFWSVKLCRFLGLTSAHFDMENPSNKVSARGAVVLTSCSMEQLGTQWKRFYQYLLRSKPKIVIHQEPLFELYGPEDFRMKTYHLQKKYLQGYLPTIPKHKILHLQRQTVGHCHWAFSELVWKP